LIHGWTQNGRYTPGLMDRHILKRERKARRAPKPQPAAYTFHEWALRLRPKVVSRLEAGIQQTLPGVRRPGEPAETAPPSATISDGQRQSFQQPSAMIADDSKTTTSTTRERFKNETLSALSLDDQEGGIDVAALVKSIARRQ